MCSFSIAMFNVCWCVYGSALNAILAFWVHRPSRLSQTVNAPVWWLKMLCFFSRTFLTFWVQHPSGSVYPIVRRTNKKCTIDHIWHTNIWTKIEMDFFFQKWYGRWSKHTFGKWAELIFLRRFNRYDSRNCIRYISLLLLFDNRSTRRQSQDSDTDSLSDYLTSGRRSSSRRSQESGTDSREKQMKV